MQISDYIKNGEKDDQLLGLEVEHFILDENNKSVYYSYEDEKPGVREIIEELSPCFDKKITENFNGEEYLIGLKREDCEISIEPGAQFEISIKACKGVDEIEDIYLKFLHEINPILDKHEYHLANIGYRPDACALEVPIIPKKRYYCMDANFKNVGTQGFCMMRCSAATQISIDYSSEEDCFKKLKIATCLSPLIYFLLDSSPIFERSKIVQNGLSPSGINIPKRMARWQIWNNADDDRCTSAEVIFENENIYEAYEKLISNLPEVYKPSHFRDDETKIKHELSMAFFDVRLKNTIEIRPADSMPKEFTFAYVEFIKNLFYNEEALNKLWEIFQDTTFVDYKQAGQKLQNEGWEASVFGNKTHDLLKKLIELAKQTESKYIEPIENLVKDKTCLKDYLNEKYDEDTSEFKPLSETVKNTLVQVKEFENCEEDLRSFLEFRKNSKVAYMDKISHTGYFSKAYDLSNQIQFEMIVKKTHRIVEKICDEYWRNPEYRNLFKWDTFSEKLINFRPNYNSNVPVARFDIFFNDATGKFQFCEFNTGGSAAMSKVTYASEEIKQTVPFKALDKYVKHKGAQLKMGKVYTLWVEQFIKIFKEWSTNVYGNSFETFTVGMVDFLDNCQLPDFGPFKKQFEKAGINCEICDLRDLSFDGSNLIWKDEVKLDAIYKRVTLDDLLHFKEHTGVEAMIDAVMAEKVCPIDWFSSQIVHDKQIFAIMNMPQTLKLMNKSEANFIKLHFPETYILNNKIIANEKFINNKNEYLLKPISSRDSKNIFIGKELDINEWKKALSKCAQEENFVIQKFCEMHKSENVLIDIEDKEHSLKSGIKQYSNMEGLYCYNSVFGGMYLRQGDNSEDGTKFDMTIPVFYEKYDN